MTGLIFVRESYPLVWVHSLDHIILQTELEFNHNKHAEIKAKTLKNEIH